MRTIISILISLHLLLSSAQESLIISPGGIGINFEDTSKYKYVSIDTGNIWQIIKPKKQILNSPYSGDFAIISDTNDFYPTNLNTSFQLSLNYEHCCDISYLSFVHKYDFEKYHDGGIIETSYDNGLTWTNIINDPIIMDYLRHADRLYTVNDTIDAFDNQPGFTGLQQAFSRVDIEFLSYGIWENNIDTMLLRFTIASDSINSNNEGWLIDDFMFNVILVDIAQVSINNNIQIVPNPTDNIFNINSPNIKIQKIELFSLSGLKVLETVKCDAINISELESGIYLVRINDSHIKKLVIK